MSLPKQLRRVQCLSNNFRISELYLQHNALVEVTGMLHHLTCLRVLLLHNNQLEKLDRVVGEFAKMQDLKTLSKYGV